MASTRSAAHRLAQLLAASPRPVYVLDDQRCIVFCNAACVEWLGVAADRLVGLRCDYCAVDGRGEDADLAATLCPPPQVFHGQRCAALIRRRDASGTSVSRLGEFIPLGATAASCCGVIALLAETDEAAYERPPKSEDDADAEEIHDQLRRLNHDLRARYRLDRLAGESPVMRRVREQIQVAVASQARVLVIGPPGSGREHVARTIHCGADPEAAGPLLPLSGPLLDAELLQTTVLAFLRRCADSPAPQPPSLLLLDVDRLPHEGQAELLAFFRVPTFRLRTLVTARGSLLELAEQHQFLHELAMSLSTLVIQLPSLAERRQDIPLLVQQLVEEHNARGGAQLSGLTTEALDQLAVLPWAGDVAELAGVVAEACGVAGGPWVTEADLPQRVKIISSAAAHPPRKEEPLVLDQFLADIERDLVQRALRRARGNKARAARLLGIPRARLLRRLAQLGLEEPHDSG